MLQGFLQSQHAGTRRGHAASGVAAGRLLLLLLLLRARCGGRHLCERGLQSLKLVHKE